MKSILLLFYLLVSLHAQTPPCPDNCVCRKLSEKPGSGLKVKCGGVPSLKVTSFKELNLTDIQSEIVHLYDTFKLFICN